MYCAEFTQPSSTEIAYTSRFVSWTRTGAGDGTLGEWSLVVRAVLTGSQGSWVLFPVLGGK